LPQTILPTPNPDIPTPIGLFEYAYRGAVDWVGGAIEGYGQGVSVSREESFFAEDLVGDDFVRTFAYPLAEPIVSVELPDGTKAVKGG